MQHNKNRYIGRCISNGSNYDTFFKYPNSNVDCGYYN